MLLGEYSFEPVIFPNPFDMESTPVNVPRVPGIVYTEDVADKWGMVGSGAVEELRTKLQAQNIMVTAIAAILPETAGAAIEHHTSIIVDLID